MELNTIKEFEANFNKVLDRVEFLLKDNHFARDNDTTLCFLYWYKFENLGEFQDTLFSIYSSYSNIFNLKRKFTAAETISRARRHLQNELGIYKPSQDAIEERIKRQEQIKDFVIRSKKDGK